MVDGEIVTGRDTIMEEQEDEDASSEEMEEYSKLLSLLLYLASRNFRLMKEIQN